MQYTDVFLPYIQLLTVLAYNNFDDDDDDDEIAYFTVRWKREA